MVTFAEVKLVRVEAMMRKEVIYFMFVMKGMRSEATSGHRIL